MNQNPTVSETPKRPLKKDFFCISCQKNRPIEQLGRTAKRSHSKRCTSCCEKANAQRARISMGMAQ